MTIDTSMIQKIREQTGARITDCKKALEESNGDIKSAQEWLRKKGIASGEKKVDRVAADGVVAVYAKGNKGVMLVINSETDFVAKNKDFLDFSKNLLDLAFSKNGLSVDELRNMSCEGESMSIEDMRLSLAGKTGENIAIKCLLSLSVNPGTVSFYAHNTLAPSIGKIGVLVSLQSEVEPELLDDVGKKIAMHIAATSPQYVRVQDISSAEIDKEKEILGAQIAEEKKNVPEDIRNKMIEGRMRKFFESMVLEEQDFVLEPGTKIKDFLSAESKRLGQNIVIDRFEKMILGS